MWCHGWGKTTDLITRCTAVVLNYGKSLFLILYVCVCVCVYIYIYIHLFIYLFIIIIIIFAAPCGMWDLSSPIRDRTRPPAVEVWSLNHWTARQVPISDSEGQGLSEKQYSK